MRLTLTEDLTELDSASECLARLAKTTVAVGLPEGAPERSRFLLALHERGSPVMRIPPRPVLAPALNAPETRNAMASALAGAAAAAAEGDAAGMDAALRAAGQAGADGIRAYIDAGVSPGNAPVTVNGGWLYNRTAKKSVRVRGKGFDRPLYDTGELYRSFDYEIRTE